LKLPCGILPERLNRQNVKTGMDVKKEKLENCKGGFHLHNNDKNVEGKLFCHICTIF